MDEKRDELDLSVARDHAEHPRNYGMLENANGHSLIKGAMWGQHGVLAQDR